MALTVSNQRVVLPAPRHRMGDQPPLIKPSDVQATSMLPHRTEMQSGVTRKVSIATNEPPKAVINAASRSLSSVPANATSIVSIETTNSTDASVRPGVASATETDSHVSA